MALGAWANMGPYLAPSLVTLYFCIDLHQNSSKGFKIDMTQWCSLRMMIWKPNGVTVKRPFCACVEKYPTPPLKVSHTQECLWFFFCMVVNLIDHLLRWGWQKLKKKNLKIIIIILIWSCYHPAGVWMRRVRLRCGARSPRTHARTHTQKTLSRATTIPSHHI